MNTEIYTKSVEQLMTEGKISLWYMGFVPDGMDTLGQQKFKKGDWWKAYIGGSKDGQGATPRAAIIDLEKKL